MLDKFSVFDLIIIAMISTLGIASKPVIVSVILSPVHIPGGAVVVFTLRWYLERESSANNSNFDRPCARIVFGTGVCHTNMTDCYTLPGLL